MEPSDNQFSRSYLYYNPPTGATTTSAAAAAAAAGGSAPPSSSASIWSQPLNANRPVPLPSPITSPVASPITSPVASPPKRKRGRPRKYHLPEEAAAARRASKDKDHGALSPSNSGSSKKSPLASPRGGGQGFTPHVMTIAVEEDVGQKIYSFAQQSKRELCVLSATGSLKTAVLRQSDKSAGLLTYQGWFDIVSLTGSYISTERGARAGGLSACLSTSDGKIIGGAVAGALIAGVPVQVIVGTFDMNKNVAGGDKGDASASKLPSPLGEASGSSFGGFRSPVDSSGGSRSPMDPFGMGVTHSQPSEWRATQGRGRSAHQSPQNGDHGQMHN
ncbi:hypothetical protein UlMin_030070 [Ulmus minor]